MAEDHSQRAPGRGLERLRPLFRPLDIASLVYFRIAFGAIMLWEVYRYLVGGRVKAYYVDPEFHFTYLGFGWVQPWPGDGMVTHFYVMGALAVCIMAGFLYRLSTALFCLSFTYVFLLEESYYLNHFYFIALVAFLLIFIPAHRAFSVDAWLRGSAWRRSMAPAWCLWVLRLQMGCVYFFAGVAKLNADWLQGYPFGEWLQLAELPAVLQSLLTPAWVGILASWAGMLFDLLVVPLLLWRPTRAWAFGASLAFHLMNAALFQIGIFPWFSIAATLLFFDPDWPRRLLRRFLGVSASAPGPTVLGWREKATGIFVVAFVTIQVLIPLRPYLYSGNTSWTDEGHRFSWRQMLQKEDGFVRFVMIDPASGRASTVDPTPYLTERQYAKLARAPYLIIEFAHYLAGAAEQQGRPRPQVRAMALSSLNGRELQQLVDETVDLAAEPQRFFTRYPWVLALQVPLEAQWDGESPPQHPATLAAIERIRADAEAKFSEAR